MPREKWRELRRPSGKEPPRAAEVELDSLEHEDPRRVGGERIRLKALEDLRFREALGEAGFGDRDARIACAAVAARMLHPASERETSRWLRETGAAAELLGLDGDERALSRKTLYRIADRLQRASEPLQAALFRRERELLDILSAEGRMKRRDRILESVGRLKEKHSKVARHYAVEVIGDDRGAEAILRARWRLSEIEAAFRSLKSELGPGPVFHQLDRRIGSHLLIAALACHPAHLVRTRLKAQGIHSGWTSIRERMRGRVRITTTLLRTDGVPVASRQDSNPGAEQALITRAAGVEPGLRRSRYALDV